MMSSDEELDSDEYEDLEESPSESDDESISSEDDSSSDDESLLDSWGWKKVDVLPSPPPPFPFIAADGIDYVYDGDASELDFYESFIDNELVDLIVTETNRYAQK